MKLAMPYTLMFSFMAIIAAILLIGCGAKSRDSSSHVAEQKLWVGVQESWAGKTLYQRSTTSSSVLGGNVAVKVLPANVLFSAPGYYQSPNGNLNVEIKRKFQNQVSYHPWCSHSGIIHSMIGPGYTINENQLVMCWDEQGRLWTYNPIEFVHYHDSKENKISRMFVGSGTKFRDEMPIAFRESLPRNIDEMLENATVNGIFHYPSVHYVAVE